MDAFDGWSVPRLSAVSHLGEELDALAGFVSFGVAPMIILFARDAHASCLIIRAALVYQAASAYRLGCYNVSASAPGFSGVPITASGIVIGVCLTLSFRTAGP